MATLYELDERLMKFELEIDEETGEILNADELEQIEMERDKKLESIGLMIKNLRSDAEAYKREKESFLKKEQTAKRKEEWLKQHLADSLKGEKFKTDRVTISYRPSKSVEVLDESKIPSEFLVQQAPKVDKVGIKKAINEGREVDGATIVSKMNIQVG